jgi:hypothetical protein
MKATSVPPKNISRNFNFFRKTKLGILPLAAALALGANTSHGALVTLTGDDAFQKSSYNSGLNWSDLLAPSSGNDYSVTGFTLRTPETGSGADFLGHSLTIDGGGQLLIRTTNNSRTYNIHNFTLNNGSISQNSTIVSSTEGVGGEITLGIGGGKFRAGANNATGTRGLSVSAVVSGSGALTAYNNNTGTNAGNFVNAVNLSGANTYSGGTTIGSIDGNRVLVDVRTTGTLGTGAVTVLGYANASGVASTLRLESTTSISMTSVLTLGDATNTNWAMELNFTGHDIIAGLVLNGVTYSAGTYGAVDSGADFTFAQFTGTGLLEVVPEPQTWALFAFSVGLGLVLRRRALARA